MRVDGVLLLPSAFWHASLQSRFVCEREPSDRRALKVGCVFPLGVLACLPASSPRFLLVCYVRACVCLLCVSLPAGRCACVCVQRRPFWPCPTLLRSRSRCAEATARAPRNPSIRPSQVRPSLRPSDRAHACIHIHARTHARVLYVKSMVEPVRACELRRCCDDIKVLAYACCVVFLFLSFLACFPYS